MNKIPMTILGAKMLQEELERLKRIERPNIVKAIEEARAHGDLKENAEYHAAKERQGFIEARIRDLESKLQHATIVDITKIPNTGKIVFGVTVTLLDLEKNSSVTYQIVGDDEADVKAGKISISSPIARSLISKKVGDVIEVKTPAGFAEYEIEKVEYI